MAANCAACRSRWKTRSEEHTSELQSLRHLVCRLLLEKKHLPITRRIYQPFVVTPDTFHAIFLQPLRGPDSKLRATRLFYAIADGDNLVHFFFIERPPTGLYPFPPNAVFLF